MLDDRKEFFAFIRGLVLEAIKNLLLGVALLIVLYFMCSLFCDVIKANLIGSTVDDIYSHLT